MIYLAVALMFCSGIAGAVYLAVNGHPWIAFAALLATAGCVDYVVKSEPRP